MSVNPQLLIYRIPRWIYGDLMYGFMTLQIARSTIVRNPQQFDGYYEQFVSSLRMEYQYGKKYEHYNHVCVNDVACSSGLSRSGLIQYKTKAFNNLQTVCCPQMSHPFRQDCFTKMHCQIPKHSPLLFKKKTEPIDHIRRKFGPSNIRHLF